MFRILAFSDTHHHINSCIKMIDRIPNVSLILHAGDVLRDCEDLQALYPNVEYVIGNNDWSFGHSAEKLIPCEDKLLFLAHGHQFGVKNSRKTLLSAARLKKADICVFGHTHIPFCGFEDGILMVNPGSSAGIYSMDATCAVIEIDRGKIGADIIKMG